MNSLQNYILFSSDRGGMRIEYAKHKMGDNTNSVLMNNNLQNNLANNAGQPQLVANQMQVGHVQTGNNMNNVPCTPVTIQNNHHVNHLNHVNNHVQHLKATPPNQTNSMNPNLNSIVNCTTSPNTQLTNQPTSVVIVSTPEQANQPNGTLIGANEPIEMEMEMVPSIEQCQYTMLVNYANRLLSLYPLSSISACPPIYKVV